MVIREPHPLLAIRLETISDTIIANSLIVVKLLIRDVIQQLQVYEQAIIIAIIDKIAIFL